uniref:Uncharacterized protein n=1 Tax=Oryza sativa subsp. japonica TaxID=39947 RepID=Q6Z172_ORYSJ|nr:hypothetical protein [Oryza sativa Japonica Group]
MAHATGRCWYSARMNLRRLVAGIGSNRGIRSWIPTVPRTSALVAKWKMSLVVLLSPRYPAWDIMRQLHLEWNG